MKTNNRYYAPRTLPAHFFRAQCAMSGDIVELRIDAPSLQIAHDKARNMGYRPLPLSLAARLARAYDVFVNTAFVALMAGVIGLTGYGLGLATVALFTN